MLARRWISWLLVGVALGAGSVGTVIAPDGMASRGNIPVTAVAGPITSVPGCAEPTFILDRQGVVDQPFSLSEGIDCLPKGDTFSNAIIHWGDGTTSTGAIANPQPSESTYGVVLVTGQHSYGLPGSFHIRISVIDDQTGQTYEGGWHTNVMVSPAAGASAYGRVFTVPQGKHRREAVATIVTTLTPDQLRANIRWDDGTTSRGVVSGSVPKLLVYGRHRWRRAGPHRIIVTLIGPNNKTLARTIAHAKVRLP